MLRQCSGLTSSLSVIRRLVFAATTLPKETPKLWEIVTAFAKKDTLTESGLTPEKARTLFENLQYMEADSLHSNE